MTPEAEYRAILQLDPCCYCGCPCEQIDHIVPKERGRRGDGKDAVLDAWDNLTSACAACNGAKRNYPLLKALWLDSVTIPGQTRSAQRWRAHVASTYSGISNSVGMPS